MIRAILLCCVIGLAGCGEKERKERTYSLDGKFISIAIDSPEMALANDMESLEWRVQRAEKTIGRLKEYLKIEEYEHRSPGWRIEGGARIYSSHVSTISFRPVCPSTSAYTWNKDKKKWEGR